MPKKSVFKRKLFENSSIASAISGIGGAETPHVRTTRGFEHQGKKHALIVASKRGALKGYKHAAHLEHPVLGHIHLHIPIMAQRPKRKSPRK